MAHGSSGDRAGRDLQGVRGPTARQVRSPGAGRRECYTGRASSHGDDARGHAPRSPYDGPCRCAETADSGLLPRRVRETRAALVPSAALDEDREEAQEGEAGMTATTAPTGPSAGSAMTTPDVAWYALAPDEVASRLEVDPAAGLTSAEADARRSKYGENTLRRGEEGVALADVLPPVRGPDADRAPRRGHRLPLPARPVLHGRLPHPADPLQRLDGHEPGGQGGGERRRPPGHDGRQGQGPPERRAGRGPDGGARPGRHREHRGRRPRPGRRAHPVRRDPRDRRVRAHRRERPHPQAGGRGRRRRRPRRPRGHGLHELPGHPRVPAPSS